MKSTIDYAVDAARMEKGLEALERIGLSQRGVTRLAYTAAEDEAHKYIREEMHAARMVTITDQFGNLYGSMRLSARKKVAVGSHLDTVVEGGNYDGALGVVMALEAARVLGEAGMSLDLEIIAFRAEESSRFNLSCIGSKLATGFLTAQGTKGILDKEKVSVYKAIESSGFNPDAPERARLNDVKFYIEPHIEQGRVLEDAGVPVGIVTGIAAPVRYLATIAGKEDHSGATPMGMRRDALAAFSEMNLGLERLALEYEGSGNAVRATIGYVDTESGTINKVPGLVSFPLDIRAPDEQIRNEFEKKVLETFAEIEKRRRVFLTRKETERGKPVALKEQDYSVIEKAAAIAGTAAIRLPSGAGHDAQYVALFGIPTAMLFVQNTGGSHNPKESVDMKNVVLATNILIQAIIEADKR